MSYKDLHGYTRDEETKRAMDEIAKMMIEENGSATFKPDGCKDAYIASLMRKGLIRIKGQADESFSKSQLSALDYDTQYYDSIKNDNKKRDDYIGSIVHAIYRRARTLEEREHPKAKQFEGNDGSM